MIANQSVILPLLSVLWDLIAHMSPIGSEHKYHIIHMDYYSSHIKRSLKHTAGIMQFVLIITSTSQQYLTDGIFWYNCNWDHDFYPNTVTLIIICHIILVLFLFQHYI